jgi:hypothetical protein
MRPRRAASGLAPLRRPFFRALSIGTMVQSVGAAWLMRSIA